MTAQKFLAVLVTMSGESGLLVLIAGVGLTPGGIYAAL